MKKLLFVCSENRLRSPTAEAVFSEYDGREAIDAGTNADTETAISGDFLQILFPDLPGKVIPVLRESKIKFKKAATNNIQAYPAVPDETRSKFVEQFSKKGRASISVDVVVKDTENTITCAGTFGWFIQSIET